MAFAVSLTISMYYFSWITFHLCQIQMVRIICFSMRLRDRLFLIFMFNTHNVGFLLFYSEIVLIDVSPTRYAVSLNILI